MMYATKQIIMKNERESEQKRQSGPTSEEDARTNNQHNFVISLKHR